MHTAGSTLDLIHCNRLITPGKVVILSQEKHAVALLRVLATGDWLCNEEHQAHNPEFTMLIKFHRRINYNGTYLTTCSSPAVARTTIRAREARLQAVGLAGRDVARSIVAIDTTY
ncbi:hypothetical protein Vafri_7415 [Volvox africanus]|uniref:Uncharacterized protein n=1 Tax=Volvox africanus TaxID=51714 RepID=A0A8J4EXR2_9CHLO|nr:hypothetical protein Vafri_7415 [Volvox africanus]